MTEIMGLGHSRKRVEDARFLQGRGNYVDDVRLPGMLHLDIVRSPTPTPKSKASDPKRLWRFLACWQ